VAVSASLTDYANAVPLNAINALHSASRTAAGDAAKVLKAVRRSERGLWDALDSAGDTGRRIMTVVAALGGTATADQLAFQTRDADPDDLAEALGRLVTAGLLVRGTGGSVSLGGQLAASMQMPSLALPNAVTNDVLAIICRTLGVPTPMPTRKQARIDAIAGVFADPYQAERVRDALSEPATTLLHRIARIGGVGALDSEIVGIEAYHLRYAAPSPYNRGIPDYLKDQGPLVALRELATLGIVGVADYGNEVWIWSEAWPLLERPFITDWPTAQRPAVVPITQRAVRMPPIIAALDRSLSAWEANPPAVLKNGEPRVAKTQVRATAKAIGSDEATVDLVGRLLIGIDLLLPNVVAASGRGRNRRVERSWMADPTLLSAWQAMPPLDRWVRLLAEWCRPSNDIGEQLLHNRQLVTWELGALEPATGVDDADALATWIAHRHGPIGHPDAVRDALADLRALGVVTDDGPIGLTHLGRAALDDPASIGEVLGAEATSAIVQADLTVVAPPDLRHDLALRLGTIADVESDSGAIVYRLSPERITRAVQAGETADGIVGFLAELSSVPLTDAVERLVTDAAARADRVRVVAAATVVIVTDPADLTTACSVKSAKLTAVSDTVAVSDVAAGKVTAALEKKGLAPHTVVDAADRPRRSSATEAAEALARAEAMRNATGPSSSFAQRRADQIEQAALARSDVSKRLQVTGPLAVTPAVASRELGSTPSTPTKKTAR
jgi:hypothetical protein